MEERAGASAVVGERCACVWGQAALVRVGVADAACVVQCEMEGDGELPGLIRSMAAESAAARRDMLHRAAKEKMMAYQRERRRTDVRP